MTTVTAQTSGPPPGALRRSFALLNPHRGLVITLGVLTVVSVAVNLVVPWLFGQAIAAIEDENEGRLVFLGLAVIGAGIVSAIVTAGGMLAAGRLATDVELTLRDRLYRHLLRLDSTFYRRRQVGQVVSLIMITSGPIRNFLAFSMTKITRDFLTFIFAGVAMAVIDPRLALAALWPVPFVVYLVIRYARVVTPELKARQEGTADVTAEAEESLRGFLAIDVLAGQQQSVERFDSRTNVWFQRAHNVARTSAVYDSAIENLPNLAWAGLFLWGGLSVLRGDLSLSLLVTFLGYVGLMLSPIANLGSRLWTAQNATASAQRVFEVLDQGPEVADAEDAELLDAARGCLALEDVTKSFDGMLKALDGVQLDIAAGRNVAIVGPTAAGKSVLLSLISRVHDPEAGLIEIDGRPIDRIVLASLRNAVRKVDSTPHLFPGTVYENLVYGDPSANRDDVIAISQTLGLHDSVAQLSDGYDTVVGEGAYQVSVPVAQAISIARAVVTKPGVILLDDVTAPFPPEAERQIIDGLRELTTDITVVAAAGRPALVGLADDIAVLDHGALSAFGQYEQLIEESSAFREILEAWRLDLGPHVGGEQ